ncbi:TPA: VRR-NUC domain-containing protein [Stenotrophomonas maltophilia]|uniref:VRR-NUC domain-containing protein n=1 Tax=Stenotrophomonas maltophilia TaxID=40324 RepID=UPI001311533C|nr:VRR-NUC domain-containing protein [Stenotrophomonas maltophilia]MCI1156847.1 VRR-NUC domain-containing protein [Stenotrophomonas maltophilia]HEL2981853.1 VRR-NUC domain-containing protein [Stenotrophomonas maltophilia]HEL3169114.1 VRR-NUC domain-containing protein [Stenotrophomonas maltophilia]HEL7666870.1 VRR-NUC domain-containing protein [Stenotrophomonas maltophilia]
MSTARQRAAEKAGFRYEQLPLACGPGPKQWVCPREGQLLSVERAALSHFTQLGWRGFSGEGGLLLTLIKAMSFQSLGYDERTRFIEALYTLAADRSYGCPYTVATLLQNLAGATQHQVAANFNHMASRGPHVEQASWGHSSNTSSVLDVFPGLEQWMLLELMAVAGPNLLLRIATLFASNPYEYRRGWPDITMWKEGHLRFVEVKAPGDSLGKSQKLIAQTFAAPLDLDFTLLDVVGPAAVP